MKLQDLFEAKGEYNSFKSWKAAVKKKNADAWIEGDEDIAQAMIGPKPYKKGETKSIGEWDGAKGELFEGRSPAAWKKILIGVDKLTPRELKDAEYVADRLLVHADNDGIELDKAAAMKLASKISEGSGGPQFDGYTRVLGQHGFKKQKSGSWYKSTGCGIVKIDKHGHWEHTDVGESEGGSEYEGTTATTLDKHLTSLGM